VIPAFSAPTDAKSTLGPKRQLTATSFGSTIGVERVGVGTVGVSVGVPDGMIGVSVGGVMGVEVAGTVVGKAAVGVAMGPSVQETSNIETPSRLRTSNDFFILASFVAVVIGDGDSLSKQCYSSALGETAILYPEAIVLLHNPSIMSMKGGRL
jgi:hypothetical protein